VNINILHLITIDSLFLHRQISNYIVFSTEEVRYIVKPSRRGKFP
jgi:hypothetical protein